MRTTLAGSSSLTMTRVPSLMSSRVSRSARSSSSKPGPVDGESPLMGNYEQQRGVVATEAPGLRPTNREDPERNSVDGQRKDGPRLAGARRSA